MENKVAILFGGDGYIGRHLISELISQSWFEQYIVYDLTKSQELCSLYDRRGVEHHCGDVRNDIDITVGDIDLANSWIFNLAAIHREPGHEFREYFDTNIPGAENVCNFARKTGINNILFTSSIAPYGRSLECRDEKSTLYPETAYGISKALAEKTHELWLSEDKKRRLIIVRPSVIFGPRDPGNVYRMIKSLKKGTFILPDGGNVIKGYGYIFGLVESMLFTMLKNDRFILYNYAENPLVPLNEMVKIAKDELKIKKPVFKLPVSLLAIIAGLISAVLRLFGKKPDIHPVRVRKAGFPTNIKPGYLIEKGFNFKYDFPNALRDWKRRSPEDF